MQLIECYPVYIKYGFLLTHPLRGATPSLLSDCVSLSFLLTHPLRGATQKQHLLFMQYINFYSHTPCGVQLNFWKPDSRKFQFLLTHPLRGATYELYQYCRRVLNFYSHTPCGVQLHVLLILTHLLTFLLTHPLRGATQRHRQKRKSLSISTHTPLAGCNGISWILKKIMQYFYSHTPCGVQRMKWLSGMRECIFLLTHPLRGATAT